VESLRTDGAGDGLRLPGSPGSSSRPAEPGREASGAGDDRALLPLTVPSLPDVSELPALSGTPVPGVPELPAIPDLAAGSGVPSAPSLPPAPEVPSVPPAPDAVRAAARVHFDRLGSPAAVAPPDRSPPSPGHAPEAVRKPSGKPSEKIPVRRDGRPAPPRRADVVAAQAGGG
jgi:hypothetical protein